MGSVKCTSFLSMKNHWATLGPDAEAQFIRTLPSDLAHRYQSLDLEKRLSIEDTTHLVVHMGRFLFPNLQESEQLKRLGALMARLDLSGLYKFLLKFATLPYAIQQVTVMWQTYHDLGEAYVDQLEKNHVHFLIFDYPGMPMKYRIFLSGWIQGLLELCKVKNLTIKLLPERPHIVYDITWS